MRIPIKDKSKPKVRGQQHVTYLRCPVILPHEILHHMASTGQVTVTKQEIEEYWNHWTAHKPSHMAASQKMHVPCGLGGDDAKYTLAGSKVVVICLNNILWDRRCRASQKAGIMVDSLQAWIVTFVCLCISLLTRAGF